MESRKHTLGDALAPRRRTVPVMVGNVQVGGGAPIVVQAMTDTDTADGQATAEQVCLLADAGAELARMTVNTAAAARTVPEIHARVRDAGCALPLIGDFHYNGHKLLRDFPECARLLDKYRINPGNVGKGNRRDPQFAEICRIARDNAKAVRIGVNAGSLDQKLVDGYMRENADNSSPTSAADALNECMVLSALESTEQAVACGLQREQIVISCKTSQPTDLIAVYRVLSKRTEQPLHLGLTEAGPGMRGIVWSTAPMAILLAEGIGDTIRVSLTPSPGGDRREEVRAAQELLQSLGLRAFAPTVIACPGCGRTTSTVFRELADDISGYVRSRAREWVKDREGVENMTIAVMGCIVNGPGESRSANLGICLPGTGEAPRCPVYADGAKVATLSGGPEELASGFKEIIESYVAEHYPRSNRGAGR